MELKKGTILQNGKYIIEKKIGSGGFGITYKGIWKIEVANPLGKTVVDYQVAIKEFFFEDYCFRDENTNMIVINSENGKAVFHKFKEKLKTEAAILLDLTHPNIVNVSEVFEENDTAYMVMEFIDGESLKDILRKKKQLEINDTLFFIKQVGSALQYIHSHNIFHLDVKPDNILIDKSGNVKLIDFGIAKQYTDKGNKTKAATVTMFSKGYSPIEQYATNRTERYNAQTDVYALGATCYHCLTGEMPVEAIVRLEQELEEPSVFNPLIPTWIDEAVMKAMALKQKDRFSSVSDFIAALDAFDIGDSKGESVTKEIKGTGEEEYPVEKNIVPETKKETKEETKKTTKNRILLGALLGIIALALIAGIIYVSIPNDKDTTAKITADKQTKIENNKEEAPIVQLENNDKPKTPPLAVNDLPARQSPDKEDKKPTVNKPTVTTNNKPSIPSDNSSQNNISPTVPQPDVEKEAVPQTTVATITVNGNKYVGNVLNGKPHGKGVMTYNQTTRISPLDRNNTMAEPGDYLNGTWNDGALERGNLFDKEQKKKASIIIGRLR